MCSTECLATRLAASGYFFTAVCRISSMARVVVDIDIILNFKVIFARVSGVSSIAIKCSRWLIFIDDSSIFWTISYQRRYKYHLKVERSVFTAVLAVF